MANELKKSQPATKEEITQAIDKLVDEQLSSTPKVEETAKAMPLSEDANGGKDKIRSGSPMSEEQKAAEADKKKKEMKKAEDEKAEAEAVEKAKAEKEKKDKEDEEKDEKKKKMEKSFEAVGELSDEEIELVKAWREEKAREDEEVAKSQSGLSGETLTKAIADAITSAVEPLKKALDAKDAQIDELNKSMQKLASQPAYDKRSLSTLEPIEKSAEEKPLSKAQIANKMLELQMQGKGVRSNHIAEFEATGNISDPSIRKMVMESF